MRHKNINIKRNKALGFSLAIIGSIMYGLNPLFCLPLYDAGYTPMIVVFYRYLLAVILLFTIMLSGRRGFAISKKALFLCFIVGLFFAVSSITLFISFTMIDAGIASVILFVYPIFVAVISSLIFHEKVSLLAKIFILAAFAGIMLLHSPSGGEINSVGFFMALASGLSYAVYLIWVNKSILKSLPVFQITFYALVSGTIMIGTYLSLVESIVIPIHCFDWLNLAGLAFFPTIGSLLTVTKAIHLIGSTSASSMGALEPVTALFITMSFFGGELSFLNVVGIVIVLTSVLFIIMEKR